EEALLDRLSPQLMRSLTPMDIVELGSGFSVKTRRLLAARGGTPLRYIPLDVDETSVAASAARLLDEDPRLEVHAVVGDFERHLARGQDREAPRRQATADGPKPEHGPPHRARAGGDALGGELVQVHARLGPRQAGRGGAAAGGLAHRSRAALRAGAGGPARAG